MTDESLRTSATLLGQIKANDQEAWKRFTQLYGPLVYGWCRNAGLEPSDAEDVGQQVFGIVFAKLETYEPGRKASGGFRSWLWGIARLRILDHFRTAGRQPVAPGGTEHNFNIQSLEADSEEPASIGDTTPRHLMLQSAIALLKQEFDPRTWQAFWDMAVKGRPAKDIGDDLDMAAKAVRQAKFRVTKKLRELLEDDFPDLANLQSLPV